MTSTETADREAEANPHYPFRCAGDRCRFCGTAGPTDITPRYGPPAPWPRRRGIGGLVLEWGPGATYAAMSSRWGDQNYREMLAPTKVRSLLDRQIEAAQELIAKADHAQAEADRLPEDSYQRGEKLLHAERLRRSAKNYVPAGVEL